MTNNYTHHTQQDQSSVMHNHRHPMRQSLTRVEDLFVDIHSEVKLSELSAELMQSVRSMAARKSSDPVFWLHAFKFLNDFKDDIYTRLWTGRDETDHLARLALAQRSATIQIRLLIRDKHLPPALQSALTHMFGPALAILMLRRSHDRQSRTLINAMQLVYEVIESYQESPISLDPYNRPAEIELKQRLHDFFKGMTGIKQALTPQALSQLQSDDDYFLTVLEFDNSSHSPPELTAQVVENETNDESNILHAPLIATPVVTAPEYNESITAPSSTEVYEPVHASGTDITPASEASTPSLKEGLSEESNVPTTTATDTHFPKNLALIALLETMMQVHRYTWFEVKACDDCRLRRLMFANYEPEQELVSFVNVRQEQCLALSLVDFSAGLKAGRIRPLPDEPALNKLLLTYLNTEGYFG